MRLAAITRAAGIFGSVLTCLFVLGLPATASAANPSSVCAGDAYPSTHVVVGTTTDFLRCGSSFNNVWILKKETDAVRDGGLICYFSALPAETAIVAVSTDFTTCQRASSTAQDPVFDNIVHITDLKTLSPKDTRSVCYFSPLPDGYVVVSSGIGPGCQHAFNPVLYPIWHVARVRNDQAICQFSPIPSGFLVIGSTSIGGDAICLGQVDPFDHRVIGHAPAKVDGAAITWVGRVGSNEGLTLTEPECGGGGTQRMDLTIRATQSNNILSGSVAGNVISTSPNCRDTVGLSFELPFNGVVSGSVSTGTVLGSVGIGGEAGVLRGIFKGAAMTGTLTFPDGASGTFEVKKQ